MPRWENLTPKQRFEKYITKTDSCWLWNGTKKVCSGMTYGNFYMNGKNWFAHRASFTLYKEAIAEGLQINHHCDNPLCVNPEHLYAGSQFENMQDMKNRDRRKGKGVMKGEENPNAKITKAIADEIRDLYNTELITQSKIAKLYGINQTQVSRIILNKLWT